MLTLPKGITIYKIFIFVLDFLITITFTIKNLQMFYATDECDSDSKKLVFLIKMDVYQKSVTQTRL